MENPLMEFHLRCAAGIFSSLRLLARPATTAASPTLLPPFRSAAMLCTRATSATSKTESLPAQLIISMQLFPWRAAGAQEIRLRLLAIPAAKRRLEAPPLLMAFVYPTSVFRRTL